MNSPLDMSIFNQPFDLDKMPGFQIATMAVNRDGKPKRQYHQRPARKAKPNGTDKLIALSRPVGGHTNHTYRAK